jgi:hypothetical protein
MSHSTSEAITQCQLPRYKEGDPVPASRLEVIRLRANQMSDKL